MKDKSTDITCDQALAETDRVMRVPEFLGKSHIKKYFYVLSRISDEEKLKVTFSLIVQESLCVCNIAYILSCSIATASHHLRMLHNADILDHRKKGEMVYYFIEGNNLKKVLAQLDR